MSTAPYIRCINSQLLDYLPKSQFRRRQNIFHNVSMVPLILPLLESFSLENIEAALILPQPTRSWVSRIQEYNKEDKFIIHLEVNLYVHLFNNQYISSSNQAYTDRVHQTVYILGILDHSSDLIFMTSDFICTLTSKFTN